MRYEPGELVFVGRPDIVVGRPASADVAYEPDEGEESTAVGILDVDVPINDKLQEWFLEIHDVETGTLVTVLEILSPFNKIHPQGREEYIKKRDEDLRVTDQPRRDRLASRRPADAASTQAGSIGLSDPDQPGSDSPQGEASHLQRSPADPLDPHSPPAGRRRAGSGSGGGVSCSLRPSPV